MNRRNFISRITSMPVVGVASTVVLSSLTSSLMAEATEELAKKPLGIALVGLGSYSKGQLGPALKLTKFVSLKGVVTGSPEKGKKWAEEYGFPETSVYSYEDFDKLKDNPEIDIVYIVLPNSMHLEYTLRAAKIGKHVISEKPIGMNAAEAKTMVDACKTAKVKLGVGYRLHFDPSHQEIIRLAKAKDYGEILAASGGFGFNISKPDQWRLKHALAGGGPLMDVGIYAIQGIRYGLGQEPIWVEASWLKPDDIRFKEVEASVAFKLGFKSGLVAEGKTSYTENYNYLRFETENGKYGIEDAYMYSGQKPFNPSGPVTIKPINQQAAHIDNFALAVQNKQAVRDDVSGMEGWRDMMVIYAIYKACASGKREATGL